MARGQQNRTHQWEWRQTGKKQTFLLAFLNLCCHQKVTPTFSVCVGGSSHFIESDQKKSSERSAQLTSAWFQIQSGRQLGLMSQRGPASAGWSDSQLLEEEEAFNVTFSDGCTLCWLADKGFLPYRCWWEGFTGFIKTRYTISVSCALNPVPLPVECDMYSVWPGEPFSLWGTWVFSDFRTPHIHFGERAIKNPTWLWHCQLLQKEGNPGSDSGMGCGLQDGERCRVLFPLTWILATPSLFIFHFLDFLEKSSSR